MGHEGKCTEIEATWGEMTLQCKRGIPGKHRGNGRDLQGKRTGNEGGMKGKPREMKGNEGEMNGTEGGMSGN